MASALKLRILTFGYAGICVSVCMYSSVLMDLEIFTFCYLKFIVLLLFFSQFLEDQQQCWLIFAVGIGVHVLH